MDGSDGTVGFEVAENPTLYHPTHSVFNLFIFFHNILPLSNICVLGYCSLNEVSRPLVSLKRVKLLSVPECYLVRARHIKVTLELIKKKKKIY